MGGLNKKHWVANGIPSGYRRCTRCEIVKPYSEYHSSRSGTDGKMCVCKTCRLLTAKIQHKNNPLDRRMLHNARGRAKKKGLEFNLELSDVLIPKICPVFQRPIESPSLDRIDSSKGYVKGNVRVISRRANILKNNATMEELEQLLADAKRIGTK